jgi:phosphoenolpyruvate synthase/pyruvate phosphate dikinase
MSDSEQMAKLYKKQISLTEWFANIKHRDTEKIRAEDNDKRETLRQLNQIISLPYDGPMKQFASAADLDENNPEFAEFLRDFGNRHCALRLIPLDKNLPKLRMRGQTVRDVMNWFAEQKIDLAKYRADFMHHKDSHTWSTIFVINQHGIFGEIIAGGHDQLTQGFHRGEAKSYEFAYDFSSWQVQPRNGGGGGYLSKVKEIVAFLLVNNAHKRAQLSQQFGATFAHNYLCGYFETVQAADDDTEFCDYSRELGKLYQDFTVNLSENRPSDNQQVLRGRGASAGIVRGTARIINSPDDEFLDGAILVARVTTPDLVNLMKKSAGIITDQGGILSHAAIIARELGKPCVVDTGDATTKLRDGQTVEIDGEKGVVKIL